IQALERFIALPNPAFNLWSFYELTSEPDRALDVARRSLEASGSPLAAWICAISLYQQSRLTEAMEALDRRRQTDLMGDLTKVLILAELPDGSRLALQEYDKLTRKYPLDGANPFGCYLIAILLGHKDRALAAFEKSNFQAGARSEATKEFQKVRLQFCR